MIKDLNKKPIVSIIIPAYNIEAYLGRCLESVLNQTLKNIEIIVVDDGSTDNTMKEISIYASRDERVKLIQKENGGVTSARLAGIKEAKGEYIGFVDGDDTVEADMFKRLLENAVEYNADISHCGYQMVFPNRVDYYYNTGRILQQDTITGLKDLIMGTFIEPGVWNKLFHKSLFYNLLANEKMDLEIKYNEDLLMNYYLFKECRKAIYEDWCPYHYIIRNNSATSASMSVKKLTDPVKVFCYLEEENSDNGKLYPVILQRMALQLVRVLSYDLNCNEEYIPVKRLAKKMLKNRFHKIMKEHTISIKNKILVLWALIWPWSFRVTHKIYAQITRTDRKYSVY